MESQDCPLAGQNQTLPQLYSTSPGTVAASSKILGPQTAFYTDPHFPRTPRNALLGHQKYLNFGLKNDALTDETAALKFALHGEPSLELEVDEYPCFFFGQNSKLKNRYVVSNSEPQDLYR